MNFEGPTPEETSAGNPEQEPFAEDVKKAVEALRRREGETEAAPIITEAYDTGKAEKLNQLDRLLNMEGGGLERLAHPDDKDESIADGLKRFFESDDEVERQQIFKQNIAPHVGA